MDTVFESMNEAQTMALAETLAMSVDRPMVYALDGDLGCGKTVFAKGFASGLGITGIVNSPTFTLVHEYTQGRLPLIHFDIYRLTEEDALYDIGWEEYLERDAVLLVEWASQLAECMPDDTVWIRIEKNLDKGEDYRKITIRDNRS